MRALLQRVSSGAVQFPFEPRIPPRSIARGLVVLVGFKTTDTEAVLRWMADKIVQLRIFPDESGKMNRSVADAGGGLLVVSQFTLYADARKGLRPSFDDSAPPAAARPLYDRFLALLRAGFSGPLECGEFGADMRVTLANEGPVTLLLEKDAATV